MNNSNEPIYDARKLGIPKMLILGIQHMFAMFGATILVPILVAGYFKDACGEPLTRGLTVSVTLFCAGFGTLIFHLCSKLKVPAFLGSSFAFLGGFYTVANLKNGIYATMNVNDKAAYACGGIVVAGLLYLAVALIFKLVGVNRVMKFLPPVVTGPIIICIGLSLAPSAISNASTNWWIAFTALAVIIIFNIWGKGMFKIIPILMGDGLATAFAGFLGGPANTTYGENTGVLELSKVYDPRVIRIAACFSIVLSFIPKFSAIISTMPAAIIGGVSFMLYGMISAIGVRNVVENKVDLTKSRNLIIAGVIFVCGLGFSDGLTFTVFGTSITLTALAVAAIAGIFLNAVLPGNDYQFGKNPEGDRSRGVYVANSDSEDEAE
mgnify:CR=1 FL=1